jgi:hypothetical protein
MANKKWQTTGPIHTLVQCPRRPMNISHNKGSHGHKTNIIAQKSKLFAASPNRLCEGENLLHLYIVEAHNRTNPLKLKIQNLRKTRIQKS